MAKPKPKTKKVPDGLYASFAHMSTGGITAYLDNQGIAVTKHWSELWEEANAHAKTITGETRVHLIEEVFGGIRQSLEQGKGTEITARNIAKALAKKGWFYPSRGGALYSGDTDNAEALKGSIRRLKIIARQNMHSAYMAGRWQRFDANRERRPYLQYIAVMDGATRPPHAALHGRVFHIDDPIWDIIFPPNGFNCRCRVRALSAQDLARKGLTVSESEIEKEDVIIRKADENGNAEIVKYRYKVNAKDSDWAMTVDAGFAYNGGKAQAKPFIPRMGGITAENEHLLSRVVDSDKLLPAGLTAEQYADAFLAEFDIKRGEVKYFTDVTGEIIPISADLLTRREAGIPPYLKSAKAGRGEYMKVLAETFKDPDEVWLAWEKEKDEWHLKRHYLRVIDLGDNLFGLGVFRREGDTWYGSTIFQTNTEKSRDVLLDYLNEKRKGIRLYRRQ